MDRRENEHQTFQQMVEGLAKAAEAAERMHLYRPDQPWLKIAANMRNISALVYEVEQTRQLRIQGLN